MPSTNAEGVWRLEQYTMDDEGTGRWAYLRAGRYDELTSHAKFIKQSPVYI